MITPATKQAANNTQPMRLLMPYASAKKGAVKYNWKSFARYLEGLREVWSYLGPQDRDEQAVMRAVKTTSPF